MKIAYLISAYNQPELLAEFIAVLDQPKEHMFVHVDKKTDIQPFRKLLQDRCIFIEEREKVFWGDISFVKAIIKLMKTASDTGKFDYYSFHSGVDFPIKPILEYEAFLEKNKGGEFITLSDCCLNRQMQKRYAGYYLFKNRSKFFLYLNYGTTKLQRYFYKRKPYKGEKMFFGSTWWTLTHDCIKYILKSVDEGKAILKYFKFVFITDEMFFHTIIGNSIFAGNVRNNNLRYIVFAPNHSNPNVITLKDKEQLVTSPHFFARKFEIQKSREIIDVLKKQIEK